MSTKYHVGTSGWMYDHWRGRYYPADLPKTKWLDFYAHTFDTVELNNSFYRVPSEKAFTRWLDSTPAGFVYAVKVNRFITHLKKLKGVEEPLAEFLKRARLLGPKLGPLLYQLPPSLHRDDGRLEAFLNQLPGDLSHAFEFRHKSWLDEGVFELLRRYKAGFCVFDMPDLTTPVVATADFAYIRFHGRECLYAGCYSDDELSAWARKIAVLSRGLKAAYVYFNNDAESFAVRNAVTLRRKLRESSG